MHYSLLLLPFISASYALPFVARDAPQLLEQIGELGKAQTELTTAVNNYDGSLLGVLPQGFSVIVAEKKVDILVLKATDTAQKSSAFTAPESREVLIALASQVDTIQVSLNALKAKYPEFKRTLTAPLVLFDLKTLKKHTGVLIAAVRAKLTAEDAGFLDLGKGVIDQAFDDAIAAYS